MERLCAICHQPLPKRADGTVRPNKKYCCYECLMEARANNFRRYYDRHREDKEWMKARCEANNKRNKERSKKIVENSYRKLYSEMMELEGEEQFEFLRNNFIRRVKK